MREVIEVGVGEHKLYKEGQLTVCNGPLVIGSLHC